MKIKKTIRFEFNQDIVETPLLYQLNRKFDVVINIRGASVTEEGGFMALELEGQQAEVDRVTVYLNKLGIEVAEVMGGAAE